MDGKQRELIVWSDVPAVPLASASGGGGFLSPFLDSDLITFCRVHGTGARGKQKKSQLWKQRKRIWRVPPRASGRGRPTRDASFLGRLTGVRGGAVGVPGRPASPARDDSAPTSRATNPPAAAGKLDCPASPPAATTCKCKRNQRFLSVLPFL